MQTFQQFLASRNIDANELTPELRKALMLQYSAELVPVDKPRSIIYIPDDTPEERWSRAIRLETCSH